MYLPTPILRNLRYTASRTVSGTPCDLCRMLARTMSVKGSMRSFLFHRCFSVPVYRIFWSTSVLTIPYTSVYELVHDDSRTVTTYRLRSHVSMHQERSISNSSNCHFATRPCWPTDFSTSTLIPDGEGRHIFGISTRRKSRGRRTGSRATSTYQ
jgi:hypothetical protein